ncbi:MAG: tetratricopeptide repeat protein [Candidatus Binataceae bacterium]
MKPAARWTLKVTALLAVAVLWGCAPSADMDQLQNNQFALRGMIANDRQQIGALQEQVTHLNNQLAEIRHNGGGPAGGKQASSVNQRLAKLESQVNALQAGTAGTPPATPGSGGENVASAVPPTATPHVAAVPPPSAPGGGAPSWREALAHEIAAARSNNDPGVDRYRSGLGQMQASKYQPAIAQFEDLQHRYPKSPLSEPAEYFSANALYELGKYEQSILQFNDLVMRFPGGRFASAALLREAQAFMKINDRIDARLTLQKLLNDHANSAEAPTAKSMMQGLS